MLNFNLKSYVPVLSFTQTPTVPVEQPPEPDVGIRWGKPSSFVFSEQGKRPDNFGPRSISHETEPDDDPPESIEIIEFDGHSSFYTIRTDTQDDLDGISRMTERIEFTGNGYVDREPDSRGKPRPPHKQKLIYEFILKLNEDE